jgi:hypothetical protein
LACWNWVANCWKTSVNDAAASTFNSPVTGPLGAADSDGAGDAESVAAGAAESDAVGVGLEPEASLDGCRAQAPSRLRVSAEQIKLDRRRAGGIDM